MDLRSSGWCSVRRIGASIPRQGWKLHVSASVWSAEEVLHRTLPILLEHADAFKVAASRSALARLNNGDAGLSQVGKFLTIYPRDGGYAVQLAVALDAATRGLRGPRIPSDRRLGPGSCVWYRYGSFSSRHLQTPIGEILPAIENADGELVPDQRTSHFDRPAWAADPFEATGLSAAAPRQKPLIAGRYLLAGALHRSPRGAVFLASDVAAGRRCVIKQAVSEAVMTEDGKDARDRLRHEAAVLRALDSEWFPRVLDLVEDDGDVYLVLEDIVGQPLGPAIHALHAAGRPTSDHQVLDYARQISCMLTYIHSAGYVYRDLKSGNLIVGDDGRLRLIDFELAHALDSSTKPFGRGTPGYMSPPQSRGSVPTPADDVYAFGAVLFLLLTGAEPSRAPDEHDLLARPNGLLNPSASPQLASLVERCLSADPPSLAAIDVELASLEPRSTTGISTTAISTTGLSNSLADAQLAERQVTVDVAGGMDVCKHATNGLDICRHTTHRIDVCKHATNLARVVARRERSLDVRRSQARRSQARRLGDSLCAAATSVADQPGLTWLSLLPGGLEIACRDVNLGCAGIVLTLAELVDAFDDPRHRAVLGEAAAWLAAAPRPPGYHVPGLYVGEAGVGAALLRAGIALGDPRLVESACERGTLVASLPYGSPDLFNGTAGRLRFHLFLFDATRETCHLAHAERAAEHLLATARRAANGMFWVAPDGFERMSGKAFVGYAHGAAGVADALLDLYDTTGDIRLFEAADRAGAWIAANAVPSLEVSSGLDSSGLDSSGLEGSGSDRSGLDGSRMKGSPLDGSGLDYPVYAGDSDGQGFWCHGAGGVGRFLLHAALVGALPGASEMAVRAARTVARATRWASPVQCHGLSGGLEFLLDMYQATGVHQYLAAAGEFGELLDAFAAEREDGSLVWIADSADRPTLDYLGGYAGVAACLLRLSEPETRPTLLSRAGFQFRSPSLSR